MATLTYEEFLTACLEFIRITQKFGDNWETKGNTQEDGAFYLYKRLYFECGSEKDMALSSQKLSENINSEMIQKDAEEDFMQCIEHLEPYDPSVVKEVISKKYITYEYHIVYNFGHLVPTLYFNAWHSSGKLLTLEEIWERVHFQFSEQIWENKWESLTQTEHPFIGRPFFQLHPCHTAKLMGQLKPKISSNSKFISQYIISWLSMFGPVIGLKLSLDYFTD